MGWVLYYLAFMAMLASTVLHVQAIRRIRSEQARLHMIISALTWRVSQLPCDECGRPFEEGTMATLRVGPGGIEVAHPFCLKPLDAEYLGDV